MENGERKEKLEIDLNTVKTAQELQTICWNFSLLSMSRKILTTKNFLRFFRKAIPSIQSQYKRSYLSIASYFLVFH